MLERHEKFFHRFCRSRETGAEKDKIRQQGSRLYWLPWTFRLIFTKRYQHLTDKWRFFIIQIAIDRKSALPGYFQKYWAGGMRRASWNLYPILHFNNKLRFSSAYFRQDPKFDALFQTWLRHCGARCGMYTVSVNLIWAERSRCW